MDLNAGRHRNKNLRKDLQEGKTTLKARIKDICFSKKTALEIERELIKNDSSCYNVMGKGEGKPRTFNNEQLKRALKLYQERETNGMSVADIVKTTGVPRSTIYAKLKEKGEFANGKD